jgi:hypothetical protein
MALPWFYTVSPRYEVFHHVLQHTINRELFELKPLFVPQSIFDAVTYREGSHHYLCGCFIKQQQINELLQGLPENSYFLFTDVDYLITNNHILNEALQSLMKKEVDMAFQYEDHHNVIPFCNINVGFALIRVNQRVKDFFGDVCRRAATESTKNDLEIMVDVLKDYKGPVEVVDSTTICMPYSVNPANLSKIAMIPILCSNSKDYRVNMKQKYITLKQYGIPIEEFIQLTIANGRTPEELGLV